MEKKKNSNIKTYKFIYKGKSPLIILDDADLDAAVE